MMSAWHAGEVSVRYTRFLSVGDTREVSVRDTMSVSVRYTKFVSTGDTRRCVCRKDRAGVGWKCKIQERCQWETSCQQKITS